MRSGVLTLAVISVGALGLLAQDTIFHTSAKVVTVTVSVTDKTGHSIADLKPGDVQLLDDGRPRDLKSFTHDLNVPLTLGLVADVSGSQREFVRKHRND